MNWDAKVFLDHYHNRTQLVINMTGEVIFEIDGFGDLVKPAWQGYADRHGLIVLRDFNSDVIYDGLKKYKKKHK